MTAKVSTGSSFFSVALLLTLLAFSLAAVAGASTLYFQDDPVPPPLPQGTPSQPGYWAQLMGPSNVSQKLAQVLATWSSNFIQPVTLILTVNGAVVLQQQAGGTQVPLPVSLLPGLNQVWLTVTDPSGNSTGSNPLSITYTPSPPVVTIANPANNAVVGTLVAVEGTVTSDARISEVSASVNNGPSFPANHQNGSFNFTAALPPGGNTVVVQATDEFGSVGEASVSVTTTPPKPGPGPEPTPGPGPGPEPGPEPPPTPGPTPTPGPVPGPGPSPGPTPPPEPPEPPMQPQPPYEQPPELRVTLQLPSTTRVPVVDLTVSSNGTSLNIYLNDVLVAFVPSGAYTGKVEGLKPGMNEIRAESRVNDPVVVTTAATEIVSYVPPAPVPQPRHGLLSVEFTAPRPPVTVSMVKGTKQYVSSDNLWGAASSPDSEAYLYVAGTVQHADTARLELFVSDGVGGEVKVADFLLPPATTGFAAVLSFTEPGTYTVKASLTEGGQRASDSLLVTVNEESVEGIAYPAAQPEQPKVIYLQGFKAPGGAINLPSAQQPPQGLYKAPGGAVPPGIVNKVLVSILAPAPGQVFFQPNCKITAKFSVGDTKTAPKTLYATVNLNGKQIDVRNVRGTYQLTVNLAPGRNVLWLNAVAADGAWAYRWHAVYCNAAPPAVLPVAPPAAVLTPPGFAGNQISIGDGASTEVLQILPPMIRSLTNPNVKYSLMPLPGGIFAVQPAVKICPSNSAYNGKLLVNTRLQTIAPPLNVSSYCNFDGVCGYGEGCGCGDCPPMLGCVNPQAYWVNAWLLKGKPLGLVCPQTFNAGALGQLPIPSNACLAALSQQRLAQMVGALPGAVLALFPLVNVFNFLNSNFVPPYLPPPQGGGYWLPGGAVPPNTRAPGGGPPPVVPWGNFNPPGSTPLALGMNTAFNSFLDVSNSRQGDLFILLVQMNQAAGGFLARPFVVGQCNDGVDNNNYNGIDDYSECQPKNFVNIILGLGVAPFVGPGPVVVAAPALPPAGAVNNYLVPLLVDCSVQPESLQACRETLLNQQAPAKCPPGTSQCADGLCSYDCTVTAQPAAPCNNDGVCDATESCACRDCFGQQSSCVEGAKCGEPAKNQLAKQGVENVVLVYSQAMPGQGGLSLVTGLFLRDGRPNFMPAPGLQCANASDWALVEEEGSPVLYCKYQGNFCSRATPFGGGMSVKQCPAASVFARKGNVLGTKNLRNYSVRFDDSCLSKPAPGACTLVLTDLAGGKRQPLFAGLLSTYPMTLATEIPSSGNAYVFTRYTLQRQDFLQLAMTVQGKLLRRNLLRRNLPLSYPCVGGPCVNGIALLAGELPAPGACACNEGTILCEGCEKCAKAEECSQVKCPSGTGLCPDGTCSPLCGPLVQPTPALGCPIGTTKCLDGSCSLTCRNTDTDYAPCNRDGVCEGTEGCTCLDCGNQADSCMPGAVCRYFGEILPDPKNPGTPLTGFGLCICPQGTALADDGSCKKDGCLPGTNRCADGSCLTECVLVGEPLKGKVKVIYENFSAPLQRGVDFSLGGAKLEEGPQLKAEGEGASVVVEYSNDFIKGQPSNVRSMVRDARGQEFLLDFTFTTQEKVESLDSLAVEIGQPAANFESGKPMFGFEAPGLSKRYEKDKPGFSILAPNRMRVEFDQKPKPGEKVRFGLVDEPAGLSGEVERLPHGLKVIFFETAPGNGEFTIQLSFEPPPAAQACDNDNACEANENCSCRDCDGKRSACSATAVCEFDLQACVCPRGTVLDWRGRCSAAAACPVGTTLCADGTCRPAVFCAFQPACNKNGVCDLGEACNCQDCLSQVSSCDRGARCAQGGNCECPTGRVQCADGTCRERAEDCEQPELFILFLKEQLTIGDRQTVQVKNNLGNTIKAASVSVEVPDGEKIEGLTDEEGQLNFTVKVPGIYAVRAVKEQLAAEKTFIAFDYFGSLLSSVTAFIEPAIEGIEQAGPFAVVLLLIVAFAAAYLAFVKSEELFPVAAKSTRQLRREQVVRMALALLALALPLLAGFSVRLGLGFLVALAEIGVAFIATYFMRRYYEGGKVIRV